MTNYVQNAAGAVHAAQPVTDADFAQLVLKSELPAVVDFWAEWCGPCRVMAPAFERLAQRYAGKASFFKLDADTSPRTPGRYDIRGIPTVIVFKGGKEAGRVVGYPGEAALTKALAQVLGD